RLTYGAAPEAVQGAIAAGILGVGRIGDGAIEIAAKTLYEISAKADAGSTDAKAAEAFVTEKVAAGEPVAGLGHPLHKNRDPRVDRLFELAAQHGFSCRYIGIIQLISERFSAMKSKSIPVNGAGAVAALYCELGFPPQFAKAATIVALSAGIAGHLMEELREPMAREMRKLIADNVKFTG